jgi:MFS family permease
LPDEATSVKIFYGWFVVAACFATTFTLGEAMWIFGIFFKPLENEFGWSRALISSGYTVFLVGYGFSVMTWGRLADRYSPRPILFVRGLLAGIGTSMCSQIHSINQLRLFLFIGALGAGATWSVPTATVQRWFYQRPRAGLALSLVVSGVGVGGLTFAPIVNHLIVVYSWRTAYLIVGMSYLLVICTSSLVIKKAPITIRSVGALHRDNTSLKEMNTGWTTTKALLTSSFVGITFIHCTGIVAFQIVCVHLVPHATDLGISGTASAVALGLLGGFSVPGRIIPGFLSQRMDWQRMVTLACVVLSLSVLFLIFLARAWMLYCFVFCFGIGHGARVSSHLGILGEFFGMESLGALIGITTAIGMFIGAFAPYLAGFIFDTTGSYSIALSILFVLLMICAVIARILKKPQPY